MTRPNHKTAKLQNTEAISPPASQNLASPVYARKLQAVQQAATDILFRIERALHDNPAAIVDRQSGMLPREIEDSRAYFLQKIQHVRNTLRELADLLQLTPETPDARELLSTELMVLFVLVESYRPQRAQESGWNPGEETQHAIREKIESLGLDIINMRERLK